MRGRINEMNAEWLSFEVIRILGRSGFGSVRPVFLDRRSDRTSDQPPLSAGAHFTANRQRSKLRLKPPIIAPLWTCFQKTFSMNSVREYNLSCVLGDRKSVV